jgi:hypothetical protein
MKIPKLKVAADPRFTEAQHSPLHRNRFVVTEDCVLEKAPFLTGGGGDSLAGDWRTVSGSVIAQMKDCDQQADLARMFAASPDMLLALQKVQAFLDDLSTSNPGYMSKLVLQSYAGWNEAMIALPNAIRKATGKP